jgi:hypothetical protein
MGSEVCKGCKTCAEGVQSERCGRAVLRKSMEDARVAHVHLGANEQLKSQVFAPQRRGTPRHAHAPGRFLMTLGLSCYPGLWGEGVLRRWTEMRCPWKLSGGAVIVKAETVAPQV